MWRHLYFFPDIRSLKITSNDTEVDGIYKSFVLAFFLNHGTEEVVDLLLSVAEVTTFHEVVGLLAPATSWGVELEGPQEVRGVLEVGANGEDLVDQIFDADDVVLAQLLLDDVVGGDGGTTAVKLGKSTLVDQLANALQVGGSPGDVGLCK